MSRDIYAGYFKETRSGNRKNEVKEAQESREKDGLMNYGDETVKLLKEISSKLNKLDERPTVATYPVQQTACRADEIDLAIINGSVVLPDNGVFKTNVYINNGKIHSIGVNESLCAREVIDASGKYVIPGVIDPHVHLGLFAPLETELETETKAALLGGVTTIGCFFGGAESHFKSFPSAVESINKSSNIDIIPHLVISTAEQRAEIPDYINHLGVTSFKVYMNGIPGVIPDVDDGFILDVMDEIKKSPKKCILCSHTENRNIVSRAYNKVKEEKGEGANIIDWTETHPDFAEEEAVTRLTNLAKQSGVKVYVVHVSSAAGIKRLRSIKPFNKYVSIETTSPYLSLTRYSAQDNSLKMEPPIRDDRDVEELWKAVEEGVVDTIGTDNVTMTRKEKRLGSSIWEVMPGYPALQTHLPVLLHEGVVKRGLPIERVIAKITKGPAEIFNVYPQKGSLMPGSDADVAIVDLNMAKTVTSSEMATRSDFSIYEGRKIHGWPVTTIKSGVVVVRDGKYLGKKPGGSFIAR
jgi:dihydropyrimidinase